VSVLSNTDSSEDNIESPLTCANKAIKNIERKKSLRIPHPEIDTTLDGRELEEGQTFQY
jgi:hypothetical protein